MGLLTFFKKSKSERPVWRNVNGEIACPGDVCAKGCDDGCPIYLNTQCLMLKRIGADDKALELYKKALAIAPDFYDAYNNMAGIYGDLGRYQDAYDYFLKAHEMKPMRPNPIYGLALCCRDLGRVEECIKWCEEYSRYAKDNRLAGLYAEMRAAQGGHTQEEAVFEDEDYKIIKACNEWLLVAKDGNYFFVNEYERYATTPRGVVLKTSYLDLAERILQDLDTYGPDDFSPESILPWHYTMIENFSKMQHKRVETVLADCFINRYDWTYTVDMEGTKWENIWGKRGAREAEIAVWLSKITHMQMTAACCIGNAYHTINVAYMLAFIMEDYTGAEREAMFEELSDIINDHSDSFVSVDVFKNFELYYGIHLNENGNVIHK